MASLDGAIADLERARSVRLSAETRAGAAWRDLVFRSITNRQLDPLATEESRYIAAVRNIDLALDRCLSRLNEQ